MTTQEVGYVIENKNFLVYLDGLPTIKVNDMVQNEEGLRGWVYSIYPDKVEVLIIDEGKLSPGQLFRKLDHKLTVPVSEEILGRAINPLGIPIDGKGPISEVGLKLLELEREAPGVKSRQFITNQFITGITFIDTIMPIGKGQRELVVGDAHSGKTDFLLDIIVNQKSTNVICIYASIGKQTVTVRNLIDSLTTNKAMANTIIIAASSSDPLPQIFLAPKTAFTVAEYFQQKGRDVLVILDDIGVHARTYREIALLSGKNPGREGYPGDIFYQHSHIFERAGNFKAEYGGGSITALPIIELNLTDLVSFIPTNLMSMTDGHLLFKQTLHNIGLNPAIDIDLSVSRVGRQTQQEIQVKLSSKIRELLAHARNLETVSRFSSLLPKETKLVLNQKEMIEELLSQDSLINIPVPIQLILITLPFTSFLVDQDVNFVKKNKSNLINAFINDYELSGLVNNVLKFKTVEELIASLEKVSPKLKTICA
jgi:F-type H+/Na+-transporting ATPase subunit alpha